MAPDSDAALLSDSRPPEPDEGAQVTVRRARREPVPLEQVPVWAELEPADRAGIGALATADPPAGLDALLGGLNPDQLRAVTHGDGPLLVVAGAGTGKTQVITRRIAWLIATRRARPSEILALTFTDKAAAEMQLRVDQLVPYGYTDAAISTFHAFGDRLIREHAFELGLPTDVRVLSRPEVVILLREHLFELGLDEYAPLGNPTRFLDALAGLFSRCKDEDVSPAAYRAFAVGLDARAIAAREGLDPATGPDDEARAAVEALEEDARRQAELAGAFERYQAILASRGAIDFGDQVSLALRLLRESPSVRADVQERFRYVLVDEFQDTNLAQAELVGIVAERHRNITVVGDDDQAIYAFRGAAIANLLQFQARYRGARVAILRRNYRSLAPILDAAYRLIRFNDPDRLEVRTGIPKRLRAERSSPVAEPVRRKAFATGGEEADWIAAEIRRRIDAGARPRDHAVLVRANADADPILRSLNLAGVAWRFAGASGLYARPEVRLLLSFLRAIADLSSSVDVYGLAASEIYRLGGEDLTAIVATARRRHRSTWEVLEELDRQPGILRVGQATRDGVHRLVTDLRRFGDLAHERPAGEVLYAFLRETGHLAALAAANTVEAEERLANVARFFEIVRAQSGLLADDRAIFLARHLQTLVDAGDDPATADLDPDVDAVAVMTVHKAKGLEFGVVFQPGLVTGRFPAMSRRDPLELPAALAPEVASELDDPRQAEERRLFYVAMTRARDELILTHAADYGGSRARRVSPFVVEALDLPAAGDAGAGAGTIPPLERLAPFGGPAEATPARRRARSSEPLTLSYYAIDDYLTCPAKYRYSQVIRVPMAPHHALVYGAALHTVIQEFHRRHARGQVMSEAELDEALEKAWTNEGFVSREHEEARLAAGRSALHRFREAQLAEGSRPPACVERSFEFLLDGDRVRGRWDRIDIEPALDSGEPPGEASAAIGGSTGAARADVTAPTLELLGRERVTITDYKSSDVRDPVKARQRARDSLQLQIYAMGWEAATGRLPEALALHFLDSGMIGRVEVEPKRIDKARARIRQAAEGIRAEDFTARPDRLACSWCPFRDICPSSAVR